MRPLAAVLIVVSCVCAAAQTTGTYTDSRDHTAYRTVRIGNQIWFADRYDAGRAYERLINYKNGSIGRDVGNIGRGFSVHYVRDVSH